MHFSNFNRSGETLKVEIRDTTYRVVHRGTYKLNSKKDLYALLSMLEKYMPFTINQIINWKNDWI